MIAAFDRILKYRRDEMMRGRDPGFVFVEAIETREMAAQAAEILRGGLATEENMRLLTRLENHAMFGNDPYSLNALKIFGMTIQVEGSAQAAS